jgi:hypothetical protein
VRRPGFTSCQAGAVVRHCQCRGGPLRRARARARPGSAAARGRAVSVETLLARPLGVINLGLEIFAREVETAGVEVVYIDWRPPAGSPDVAALLARLDDDV